MMKVLVVVDMQNDFVDGSLGTKEAVMIAQKVADKIYGFDGKIYCTFDTHFEDYLNSREGRKLPVEHCISGRRGWELNWWVEQALAGKDRTDVRKVTFGSVALPGIIKEDMRKAGETEVQIQFVGLCTDICVVSNVLITKAFFPEADISVDASCCAGVTPEAHEAALAVMRSCQIDVIGG